MNLRTFHQNMRFVVAAVILSLAAVENVHCQILSWNAASGDWYSSSNWSPFGPPASNRVVVINNGGTATIEAAANPAAANSISIGSSASGSLELLNGGLLNNLSGTVGEFGGSSGSVTVDGDGSQWTNTATLAVGFSGSGTLNVQNGGVVNSPVASIGAGSGATGVVTVNGNNSNLNAATSLVVGQSGTGTLNVQSGATVTATQTSVASNSGSTGSATVTGTGSQLHTTGNFYLGGSSSGAGGVGTLNITNGGEVEVGGLFKIWNSVGSELVINGGTLRVGSFERPGGSGLFNLLDGTLEVGGSTQGTFVWGSQSLILTSADDQTTVSLVLHNVAPLTISEVYVGDGPGQTARLTLSGGTQLTSGSNLNDFFVVGFDNGAGSVIVDGTGTRLSLARSDSWTVIGTTGSGSMTVRNGGTLSAGLVFVGFSSSGEGELIVTGAGSTATSTTSMSVGGTLLQSGGSGMLSLSDGASVSATEFIQLWLRGTLHLDGATVTTPLLRLRGGTVATESDFGDSELLGDLQILDSSTLQLGTGFHTLTLQDVLYSAGTLSILGWNGALGGQVHFAGLQSSNPNLDYAPFLANVQFHGYALGEAEFLDLGGGLFNLVAVPEPSAALLTALGLFMLIFLKSRRRVSSFR